MQQLDADFFNPRTGLYAVSDSGHEPQAALWPTSQVLSAAIALARLTNAPQDIARVRRIIASLGAYASPFGAYHSRVIHSHRYYDDNTWVALDLLDAYAMLGDQQYLTRAMAISDFLTSGWSITLGGVVWVEGGSERPTISNGGSIIVDLRLAALTHVSAYEDWAQRIYQWENATLRAGSGLYWDHIDGDGTIDHDIVSYNQAVMIEANLAFAALTHKAAYLQAAQSIAQASAAALTGVGHNRGRAAMYDAMYFEALAHLNTALPNSASLAPANAFLSWFWPIASAPRSATDHTEQSLLEQTAFIVTACADAGP
jgi:predicted alpha-1,6-mannanase (GH76 family)